MMGALAIRVAGVGDSGFIIGQRNQNKVRRGLRVVRISVHEFGVSQFRRAARTRSLELNLA